LFPAPTDPLRKMEDALIPRFDATQDPEGAASYVPHMDYFYDNSIQSGQMRDLAIDFELLDEHLVLLGNQVRFNGNLPQTTRFSLTITQGVGKNKLIDRLCQVVALAGSGVARC
jgi:hypothetical protein